MNVGSIYKITPSTGILYPMSYWFIVVEKNEANEYVVFLIKKGWFQGEQKIWQSCSVMIKEEWPPGMLENLKRAYTFEEVA